MRKLIKSRFLNLVSAILSMSLLMVFTTSVFAAPPTGVPAMQANANVATVALGKVLQLEDKVKELHKLRRLGNAKNSARIARLEQEIRQVKQESCANAQDYRACIDKQDEVERKMVQSFNELMTGCSDETQVSVEGVDIGKKKVCRDGQGILSGRMQGNLNMTTVRTPGGSLITTQQWTSPAPASNNTVASNLSAQDLNPNINWTKVGAMSGGCLVGAVGGGFSGNAIGGALWRDQITVRADGQKEVIHGGADAGTAIGAVAGCGVGAFVGWLATK